MSDTFPDETLYPVLISIADEDRIFASNSAAGHESSQIKGSTIKGLINALKGTPPETLDTLAKLASAINNDPAFHSTLTTALAGKAPLASPALTGTPTAPTAAKGTNTTQIASTGYVYENYKQTCTYTQGGSTTVDPAVPGKLYSFTGAGTLVLPVASTVPDGSIIDVFCQSTVETVTISSETRIINILGSTSYSFSLTGYGNTVRFQSIGAGSGYWMVLFDPVRAIELAKVSPALTGTPTAPTAAVGTNTTQLATTAFCAAGFLPRFEAVVERTAATTAQPNKLYVNVKDASAENTLMLTLPSPTGNAGKVIGLSSRYRRSSYTNEEANWRLTGHIDGIASNTYWQGYWELGSALLWCDGTTWHMLTDWRAEQEW